MATRRALGAWQLPIADLDDVVGTIVTCRVGGGNDAAAMRVVRREIGLPWLALFGSKLEESKRAAGILFGHAVSYLLGVDRNR